MSQAATTELSIVIPLLNESESVTPLAEEIFGLWSTAAIPARTEVIFVDDGSSDATFERLLEIRNISPGPKVRILRHKRTFGQTRALGLGFQLSKGELVVALDGDGQNDPNDIAAMLEFQESLGVDCVSGWREFRGGDSRTRVFFSKIANYLLMKASMVPIRDSGCTLKVYRGEVIRGISLHGDMHRIIPFQIEMAGGSVAEIRVNHRARLAGESKYSLARTFRVIQDLVVVYFTRRFLFRPMHLLGTLGSLVLLLGFLGILVATGLKIFQVFDFVETPILLLSLVLSIGGLNIMGTGLIGEMINRHLSVSARIMSPESLGWEEV